jgi:hypothetical protein
MNIQSVVETSFIVTASSPPVNLFPSLEESDIIDTTTLTAANNEIEQTEFEYNSYFDPNETETIVSNITTIHHKKQRVFSNKEEIGVFSVPIFTNKNGKRVLTKTSVYATKCVPNAKIRNAITGLYEDYYVGKTDEDLFFKVRFATGQFGKNPFGTDLYFNSPEEYEKYFCTHLHVNVKNKWNTKFTIAKDKCMKQTAKKINYNKKHTIIH